MKKAKPRAAHERHYTLKELRSVWGIRLPNRHLFIMLFAGTFPMPRRTAAGQMFWGESEIVSWIATHGRLPLRVKYEPFTGLATTREDHDRAATPATVEILKRHPRT